VAGGHRSKLLFYSYGFVQLKNSFSVHMAGGAGQNSYFVRMPGGRSKFLFCSYEWGQDKFLLFDMIGVGQNSYFVHMAGGRSKIFFCSHGWGHVRILL
jgi:hypothetical protein